MSFMLFATIYTKYTSHVLTCSPSRLQNDTLLIYHDSLEASYDSKACCTWILDRDTSNQVH